MSDFLEATVKNPRWWAVMPFTLLVILPLVIVQMLVRLVAFLTSRLDHGIEIFAGSINRSVHAWWREEAARRQEAARLPADF